MLHEIDEVSGTVRGEVGLPKVDDLVSDGNTLYKVLWVGVHRTDPTGLWARASCVILDWDEVEEEEADEAEVVFTPDPEPGQEVWDDATKQWVLPSRVRGW